VGDLKRAAEGQHALERPPSSPLGKLDVGYARRASVHVWPWAGPALPEQIVQARQCQRLFQRFCRLTPLLRVSLRDITQCRFKAPRDHRWRECATDIAAPLAIGPVDQIEPERADERVVRALRIVARNPLQRHAHVQPIRLAGGGGADRLEDR